MLDLLVVHLCSQYGPSLPVGSLRSAVLAFTALGLPSPALREKAKLYYCEGRIAIAHKIRTEDQVGTIDAFAMHLLGAVAWRIGGVRDLREFAIPVQRYYRHLIHNTDGKEAATSPILCAMIPLVQNWITINNIFLTANQSKSRSPYSIRERTFQHHFRIHDTIRQLDQRYVVGIYGAISMTLAELLSRLIRCLHQAAQEVELKDDTRIGVKREQRFIWVNEVLDRVQEELNDLEFQAAFNSASESVDCRTSSPSENLQAEMVIYNSQKHDCIRLAIAILQNSSVLEGLTSPDVHSIVRSLIASLQLNPPWRTEKLSKTLNLRLCIPMLALVGMGVNPKEVAECNTIFY